jgi:hypothetical protein
MCTRCGAGGTLRPDGVYEFDTSDVYRGEIDRGLLGTINVAAHERGWPQALESHLRPARPDLVDDVADASHADRRVLLPLERARTVVLDVGAGWGANSFGVAADVLCVVAMEKIGERIDWIASRAREDGVENLIPVRADLQWSPFSPGSFTDDYTGKGIPGGSWPRPTSADRWDRDAGLEQASGEPSPAASLSSCASLCPAAAGRNSSPSRRSRFRVSYEKNPNGDRGQLRPR